MNISMILIVFSNIVAFLLTLVNFGTQMRGSGLCGEEDLIEMFKLRNIYILTFFCFSGESSVLRGNPLPFKNDAPAP